MSNPFTKQQIQERFESLPPDIQQVVQGDAMVKRLEVIGRNHDLRIDGIGVLIEYSGLIMLGLIKSNEFVSHLQKQLNLSREQAETIAIEVDEQVFSRIRESLRKVQYQSTGESRFGESEQEMPSSHPHKQTHRDSASEPNMPPRESQAEQSAKQAVGDAARSSDGQAPETQASTDTTQSSASPDPLADNMATTDFMPSQSAQSEAARNSHSNNEASPTSPEAQRQSSQDSADDEIEHAINQAVQEVESQTNPHAAQANQSEVPHVNPTGLEGQGVDIDFDSTQAAIGAGVDSLGQADAMRAHQAADTANQTNQSSAQGTPTQSPFGPSAQADNSPVQYQAAGSQSESFADQPMSSQDASSESATPAMEADPERMKDFQTRLQERLNKEDTSDLDNDPYRESIKE